MAPNRFMSDIDFTKTQLAVYFLTMIMAVDFINPVKIFLHVFPDIKPWHVVVLCVGLMTYVFISQFKALLYYSVKIFFHSILSIFFREVEIVGRDNIPRFGPTIFVINHANQFIDAVTVLCTCEHKLSYLMAEASWKRRIVGDIAWALEVVPVKRAQDEAIPGTGLVQFVRTEVSEGHHTMEVLGTSTMFTQQLRPGDKIRPFDTATAFKVTSVESDTLLTLESEYDEPEVPGAVISDDPPPKPLYLSQPVTFDIFKRIDQSVVYEKVLDRLAEGGSVGIFPEGGSHDRTDLLPLKVGVALVAYMALDRDGVNVPIVPVGLNYFAAHRWRGRAVVEYGQPILLNPNTLSQFRAGGAAKHRVCNDLLDQIQDSMKSVIVSTPDYETLQVIYTARRLYQRKTYLNVEEKQDLNRRFAEGYKRLLLMTKGHPPAEWLELQQRITAYRRELRDLGIRDYQVPTFSREKNEDIDGDVVLREMQLPYQIVHLVVLLLLAAIPSIFLNLPVRLLADLYSERRRKKALAHSKVKVQGFDVMMTEKILFCIVMVPTFWIFYGLVLYYFTNLDGPSIALAFLCMPLFAYMGIIVSEAGMVDWKDVRPYFIRLLPSVRRRLAALPATRRQLQADLRAFIKRLGPALGEIYYGKDLDWKAIMEKSRVLSTADLQSAEQTPALGIKSKES